MRREARELTREMESLLRMLAVGAVLLALLGCERPADPTRRTIAREQFIEVYVALRQIDDSDLSAAEQRAAVLDEHGVTEDEMRAFIEARADRPQELAEIWEEIQAQIERRQQEEEQEEEEQEDEEDEDVGPEEGLRSPPPV